MLAFDHVNIRTANLERAVAFYEEVLGMTSGKRPPFPFPGAWMYIGEQALVHLVAIDEAPDLPHAPEALRLEHFAFRGEDLGGQRARLAKAGVAVEEVLVPGFNILQLNFYDPDGNHIHVDFKPE
ncbi:MAG: VOC family protein [Pseudomonadota bacterium]